jgi:hypothetical protein
LLDTFKKRREEKMNVSKACAGTRPGLAVQNFSGIYFAHVLNEGPDMTPTCEMQWYLQKLSTE